MIKVPCKGCTKRCLHCHSSCEQYAEYRKQIEAHRAREKAEYDTESFFFSVKSQLMHKGAQRMYYSSNRKAGNK